MVAGYAELRKIRRIIQIQGESRRIMNGAAIGQRTGERMTIIATILGPDDKILVNIRVSSRVIGQWKLNPPGGYLAAGCTLTGLGRQEQTNREEGCAACQRQGKCSHSSNCHWLFRQGIINPCGILENLQEINANILVPKPPGRRVTKIIQLS
jgi:hypothetical protein